ncbi:ABC transporter substrate-binding protein [Hoyosella altamirensis]|uniref:Peptide/nickel transport system substrate-binding protein n=1 Tax=Hoyosella altamirensis TaxID=616997 RepID=A0A839RUC4_9ACTN|nr:ABC transporter substrate-binding protein [Hoyosella altamirensis]MBB3039959.1 peptide/nickel transport system substrate-binding protein [Hoyosella altamirensis]
MSGRSRMRWTKVGIASLAVAATTGSLASCATSDPLREVTLGYAVDAPITTYNANTVTGALSAGPAIFGRVLTGLSYPGPDGAPLEDRDFGTIEQIPGEAFTFQVTIRDEAVFSDGEPITCDDLVLAWAAGSGRFTVDDPESEETRPLFDAASDWGFADIENVGCEPGTKQARVELREGRPFTDWRELFSATTVMPAHVAGRAADVPDIVGAVASEDLDALGRLAEFWNNGWTLEPGELDLSLYPSSGPYMIESFSEENGLILERNPQWWGDPPRTPRIAVWTGREIRDAVARDDAHVVDVGAGSVAGLDLGGFTEQLVPSLNNEQLIFNTRGIFGNVDARRAFTACIPRQRIADDIVAPLYEDHADLSERYGPVASSRVVPVGAAGYDFIAGPAQQAYLQPDIEAARAFPELDGARIRVGYTGPDRRREEIVSFLARTCSEAGIIVQNVSSPAFNPSEAIRAGEVDIVVGGSGGIQGPGGLRSAGAQLVTLHSRSPLNIGAFSFEALDGVIAELAVTGQQDARYERLAEAERIMWGELPSVPLAVQPRVTAHDDAVVGVVPNGSKAGAGWNMDKWVRE